MKYSIISTILGLLTTSIVNASRSDFFGENDNRPELFKLLDDHIGTFKITLDDEEWTAMKNGLTLAPYGASEAPKYEVNNGTLEFLIEGTDYRVTLGPSQFEFQLGGSGSRNYVKPGYNIKLKKGNTIGEVKSLRLRGNIRDPTLMREKISSDILYRMGIPSTSTNYANLIVNGEDLGIFVLTNKIKRDFAEKYYGDESPDNLYECKKAGSRFDNNGVAEWCENVKDELNDSRDDLIAFNEAINKATSVEEIEKVLDVDHFLRVAAFEFLTDSWDHFITYSHNYFWYKRKEDGKWLIFLKDYDETFGNNFYSFIFAYFTEYADRSYVPGDDELNIVNMSIRDLDYDHKFLKYLIHDDDTRFRKILGEVVKEIFNPKVLLSRINEIAELIRDDIKSTRTPDETGYAKGNLNTLGFNPQFNLTHFDDCIGDGNWRSNASNTVTYGLKYFIEERFKYVCHTYGIDPETLELIEPRPKASYWGIKNQYKPTVYGDDLFKDDMVRFVYTDIDKEYYMQEEYNADPEKNNKPVGYVIPPFKYELPEENPTETVTSAATTTITSEETTTSEECWSEALGYPCCTSTCHVYETDADGEWGYENKHWCGIPSTCSEGNCWSKKLGYPCCTTSSEVYETDANGEWGYEDNHWCGISKENN